MNERPLGEDIFQPSYPKDHIKLCTSDATVSIYPENASPSFISISGVRYSGRNLGKDDPLAIADKIMSVISGTRQIFRSGLNRVNIFCENRINANTLVISQELKEKGYIVSIPPQLFIRNYSSMVFR